MCSIFCEEERCISIYGGHKGKVEEFKLKEKWVNCWTDIVYLCKNGVKINKKNIKRKL